MKRYVIDGILAVITVILLILYPTDCASAGKKKLNISRKNLSMKVGDKKVLRIKGTRDKVKWSSSKKKVAVVNKKGVVTAKREGKTKIMGNVNKKKYTCVVNVTKKVKNKPKPTNTPDVNAADASVTESTITDNTEAGAVVYEPPVPGRVIIHRGKKSVAPENTVAACEQAIKSGYGILEVDVRFTSDNVPVILHDATIDRTSDGTGYINSMTYEEVLRYNFGWKDGHAGMRIPELESIVALCKLYGCSVYLELKDELINDQQAEIIDNIIRKYDIYSNVTFISFEVDNLITILGKIPDIRCGLIVKSFGEPDIIDRLNKIRKVSEGDIFADGSCNPLSLNETNIKVLHDAGYPAEAWTFPNPYAPTAEQLALLNGFTTEL